MNSESTSALLLSIRSERCRPGHAPGRRLWLAVHGRREWSAGSKIDRAEYYVMAGPTMEANRREVTRTKGSMGAVMQRAERRGSRVAHRRLEGALLSIEWLESDQMAWPGRASW
jgi:hypothetical protein